ncbi:PREDICTED: uncharacterized protein LOC109207013 isoform X2 [Nicotiana attenuata]|uniref:uncharacterized protein LOC109207013 isoform X2 n=1 Tax=Nicotiana attenuata TaxID=49451 RepID=UPI000905825E|nr:PREDICTED: uncharacterized protein LOC109207013 isoform X2 [Nicotiana attenuata]
MVHCQWQPNFHSISIKKDLSWKCRPSNRVSINRIRGVQCCSSNSSFPVSSTTREEEVGLKVEVGNVGKQRGNYEVDCFVNENGWLVRRMIETEEEMKKVAGVQAEAFHEPVFIFNDIFLEFFQAEVLSGLLYRLRNSPPDRYACLVAEPSSDSPQDIVGVVDATAFRDNDVLQYLPGAAEYLYISGIAVLNKFSLTLHICKRLFPPLEPVSSWSDGINFTRGRKLQLLCLRLVMCLQDFGVSTISP